MIGSIIPYTKPNIPEGFLVCDGSPVSRTDYSDLFAVIGTTYGAGDGTSTFNLPSLNGRVVIGLSQDHAIGVPGGEENHTLVADEIPTHTHTVPTHGHLHDIVMQTPQLSHTVSSQPAYSYTAVSSAASRSRVGSGTSFIINVKTSSMSRTDASIADHPATACTMSGSITDCPAFDTEATGSGDAHNNMMPYIALVYLIQAEPDTPPGPIIPSMVLFNGAMPVGPSGCYIAGSR